jgi:SAM-dependent methyltransferase
MRDWHAHGYDSFYRDFDSPLMRRLRSAAYGEDIGQHSWVGAEELRTDVHRLALAPESRLLDLGCGPCGPLTFVIAAVGCTGTGLERSAAALRAGRDRADALGVAGRLTLEEGDLNEPLPFGAGSFEAAMSLDVVCHVRERGQLFHEIARVLSPGGRFLFTDPCVVTGEISAEETRRRSAHGHTEFAAAGWNEALLASAGLRTIESQDRTAAVLRNAGGRLTAMQAHRAELVRVLGGGGFDSVRDYLECVISLARRGALSRVMYLAETGPVPGRRRAGAEP